MGCPVSTPHALLRQDPGGLLAAKSRSVQTLERGPGQGAGAGRRGARAGGPLSRGLEGACESRWGPGRWVSQEPEPPPPAQSSSSCVGTAWLQVARGPGCPLSIEGQAPGAVSWACRGSEPRSRLQICNLCGQGGGCGGGGGHPVVCGRGWPGAQEMLDGGRGGGGGSKQEGSLSSGWGGAELRGTQRRRQSLGPLGGELGVGAQPSGQGADGSLGARAPMRAAPGPTVTPVGPGVRGGGL